MTYLVRLWLNGVVGFSFFFIFLCSCHAQVCQSSEQAARGEKRDFHKRGGLSKTDSILWLKAEKCKIIELGSSQHVFILLWSETVFYSELHFLIR